MLAQPKLDVRNPYEIQVNTKQNGRITNYDLEQALAS